MEPDKTHACVVGQTGVVVPQSRTQSLQRRCSLQFRVFRRQFVKTELFDGVDHAVEPAVPVVIFEDEECGSGSNRVPMSGGRRLPTGADAVEVGTVEPHNPFGRGAGIVIGKGQKLVNGRAFGPRRGGHDDEAVRVQIQESLAAVANPSA